MRREWTHTDKSGWGFGPWLWEPDKVQWIDAATGLDCLAVRNDLGVWCGYVGLPPGHKLHGAGYDDVEEHAAHGGLTFSGPCAKGPTTHGHPADEGHGICHVPAPGRPADVWWLGFDCCHAGDCTPQHNALFRGRFPRMRTSPRGHEDEVYRDLAYVTRCCQQLAGELAGE
jgi:hypothetical protein